MLVWRSKLILSTVSPIITDIISKACILPRWSTLSLKESYSPWTMHRLTNVLSFVNIDRYLSIENEQYLSLCLIKYCWFFRIGIKMWESLESKIKSLSSTTWNLLSHPWKEWRKELLGNKHSKFARPSTPERSLLRQRQRHQLVLINKKPTQSNDTDNSHVSEVTTNMKMN